MICATVFRFSLALPLTLVVVALLDPVQAAGGVPLANVALRSTLLDDDRDAPLQVGRVTESCTPNDDDCGGLGAGSCVPVRDEPVQRVAPVDASHHLGCLVAGTALSRVG